MPVAGQYMPKISRLLPLTNHEIEHISLLVGPVQSQRLHPVGKYWICLGSVEDIQSPVQILLVFSEVDIDGVKDVPKRDLAMKSRDKEPCT